MYKQTCDDIEEYVTNTAKDIEEEDTAEDTDNLIGVNISLKRIEKRREEMEIQYNQVESLTTEVFFHLGLSWHSICIMGKSSRDTARNN